MSAPEPHDFVDTDGRRWRVEMVSHGRTSDYLNPRVHRAILQFTSLEPPLSRRYASAPLGLTNFKADLGDARLRAILADAKKH